jgi:hypothetical protein
MLRAHPPGGDMIHPGGVHGTEYVEMNIKKRDALCHNHFREMVKIQSWKEQNIACGFTKTLPTP